MLIFGAKIQMYLFRSCKMRLFKSDFQTLWNGLNFIPETFLDFYREIAKGRLREEVIYAVSFGHLQGYPPKDAKVHSTWCKHRILALAVVKISFQISGFIH